MLHLHFQGDYHSVSIRFQISLVLIIFLFRLSVFEIVSSHIYFLGGYTKKGIFGLAQKSYSFGLGKESCGFCLSHIDLLFCLDSVTHLFFRFLAAMASSRTSTAGNLCIG
jgi:hypothetical protein